MKIEIKTKNSIANIKLIDLDRNIHDYSDFTLEDKWYKVIVPGTRQGVSDIIINEESIGHCLNSGCNTSNGYEIWIHGNLSVYFSRIADCIAQDDLLRFKDLPRKYLFTESWNEAVQGDFIPTSVKQFFANGEGPYWYHRSDLNALPYIEYDGETVDKQIDLDEDLKYVDTKFYGQGSCKSLKANPVLPTMDVEKIKGPKLRKAMQQFGFTDILQMQYVELQPNSVLPVHKDDFYYEDGRSIIDGPTQLYFVLSGSSADIKFKFKNVGLIDVSKPIFINNHRFVHSLVYTGKVKRGVLLAYGIRKN